MGVLEWRNGPSYFWNGVVDGSGGHFWTGWEEWMALRFKWMVPKSAALIQYRIKNKARTRYRIKTGDRLARGNPRCRYVLSLPLILGFMTRPWNGGVSNLQCTQNNAYTAISQPIHDAPNLTFSENPQSITEVRYVNQRFRDGSMTLRCYEKRAAWVQ